MTLLLLFLFLSPAQAVFLPADTLQTLGLLLTW